MPAAQRHIELEADQAMNANTSTEAVAATITTSSVSADAATVAPAAAQAMTSAWAPLAAISAETERESATVMAALASRGIKLSRKNVDAVAAAMETDAENARGLTVEPTVSL